MKNDKLELNLSAMKNFNEMSCIYILHNLYYHPNQEINLNIVIKKLGPELRRFSAIYKKDDYSADSFEGGRELHFVFEGISYQEEMQLNSLEIDCKTCTISKESLDQLVSNGFNRLEVLKLNLIMDNDLSDDDNVQENEKLWDKLEKYCESYLETFNICIRNWDGHEEIFALDSSCTDQKEKYTYKGYYIEDNSDYEQM